MNKIKEYRLEFKLSQKEIADILVITQSQYSKLERGESIINATQLITLSNLFNCTPNDLLGFKEIHAIAIGPLYED